MKPKLYCPIRNDLCIHPYNGDEGKLMDTNDGTFCLFWSADNENCMILFIIWEKYWELVETAEQRFTDKHSQHIKTKDNELVIFCPKCKEELAVDLVGFEDELSNLESWIIEGAKCHNSQCQLFNFELKIKIDLKKEDQVK